METANRVQGTNYSKGANTFVKRLLACLIWCGVAPAWASLPYAYVANNGNIHTVNGTVSVLNWMTGELVTTITVEGRPLCVTTNPNGKFLYVLSESDPKNYSIVSVIDTADNQIKVKKTIPGVGASGASSIAVTRDGDYFWVTKHDGSVLVYCAHYYVVLDKLILAGESPDAVGLIFSPDDKVAYVLAQDPTLGSFVAAFATGNKHLIATVNYGTYASAMAMTPDGRELYVGDYGGPVNVISTETYTITNVIPIYDAPSMAATPDGNYIWISSESQDFTTSQINIIETATNNVVQTAQQSPDIAPFTLGFTPDGNYAYESDGSDLLQVVSTQTGTVARTIEVGEQPISAAFMPVNPI